MSGIRDWEEGEMPFIGAAAAEDSYVKYELMALTFPPPLYVCVHIAVLIVL